MGHGVNVPGTATSSLYNHTMAPVAHPRRFHCIRPQLGGPPLLSDETPCHVLSHRTHQRGALVSLLLLDQRRVGVRGLDRGLGACWRVQVLDIPRDMALRPDGGVLNLASQQVTSPCLRGPFEKVVEALPSPCSCLSDASVSGEAVTAECLTAAMV